MKGGGGSNAPSFSNMTTATIALDNETHLIGRFNTSPKMICTTACAGPSYKDVELVKWDEGAEELWGDILATPSISIVGQNIAYDMRTTAARFPKLLPAIFKAYRENRVTDISVRQQLWDIARGNVHKEDKLNSYSLGWLVKLLFNEKVAGKEGDDIWRLRYSELEFIHSSDWPAEATEYAKKDPWYTWRVWDAQNEVQDEIRGEFVKTFTAFSLSLAECRGMRTDAQKVALFEQHHRAVTDELQAELIDAGLLAWEKGRWVKKIKPAIARIKNACEARGIPVPLTETGKSIATDKVACLLSQDKLMIQRVKYALAEKMLTTYLPVAQAGITGPITTRFAMAGTGRTTSSSPRPPLIGSNIQTAPRLGGYRECHVPRSGYVFGAADISGAELHTLAQKCLDVLGYTVLGDRLQNGDDIHGVMGARLLRMEESEYFELLKAGDKKAKDARQDAKAANFGFPGGMHENTFVITQIKQRERFWTHAEAHYLRETWLDTFPEMQEYFRYCNDELGPTRRAIVEINHLGMLRCVRTFNQIANTFFQAPAAAGALDGLNEIVYRSFCDRDSALFGSRLCDFVHDENIMEMPPEKAPDAVVLMAHIMEKEFEKSAPDFPVEVEPVLMSYWSKDAKPVFGTDGKLVPWCG